jgi:hypothetical protein
MEYPNGLLSCTLLVDQRGIMACLLAEENKDIRENVDDMRRLLIVDQNSSQQRKL